MNNPMSIEAKMKRLIGFAFALAFVAALAIPLVVLFLQGAENVNAIALGGIFGAVILVVISAVLLAKWAECAKKMATDASRLATVASAIAVGNLSEQLRTDAPDEIGQIEGALAQLALVQRGFAKDVSDFVRRHSQGDSAARIDEKLYAGNYVEMITGINATVSGLANSVATAANTAKALADGDLKASFSSGRKSEADIALEELRKKLEVQVRELSEVQAAAVLARDVAAAAKQEVEIAKREAANAREDTTAAKREASAASAEAAAAKRDSATARREAERAVSQLKSATAIVPRMGKVTPASTLATRPLDPSVPRLRSHDSAPAPALKSVKVAAPSGAHEYDRRDFGKY